jgi:HlyD family secretion protein
MVNLNAAESQVATAKITFDNARQELDRYKTLLDQKLISEIEFNRFQLDFQLRQKELETARSNLQLVKSGAIKGSGKVSNMVTSTVAGMVIEVPVKEGASVIESNNFNPGTTIAFVADMGDMIFDGRVDESEVGKIKEGMPLDIRIGAIDKQRFKGKLEYIAPKGEAIEGAIQFEIKASMEPAKDVFVRANYSANADIVLDRRDQVLAINEGLLQFEKDGSSFVEVEVSPKKFEKRVIKTGLSDGINIEVLDGVTLADKIKKPDSGQAAGSEQRGGKRKH